MNIVGRINNVIYINLDGPRVITELTCIDFDPDYIEYIPEYSSEYFVELAVYGESQYMEQTPVTKADKIAYDKRIVF